MGRSLTAGRPLLLASVVWELIAAAVLFTLLGGDEAIAVARYTLLLLVAAELGALALALLFERRAIGQERGIRRWCRDAGCVCTFRPVAAYRSKAHARVRAARRSLRGGEHGVRIIVEGVAEGLPFTALEHAVILRRGREKMLAVTSAGATEAPCTWPRLVATASPTPQWADMLGGWADVTIGEEPALRRWSVRSEDPERAAALFGPKVLELLAHAPRDETWAIGDGWIVCLRIGPMTVERLRAVTRRPARFVDGAEELRERDEAREAA
jgi:hypothetical protein